MPLDVRRDPEMPFPVIEMKGLVRPADLFGGIESAYASGHLAPGADRMVRISPQANLFLLDLHVLARLRDVIHEFEREAQGAAPGSDYRLAIVVANPIHRGIAELYAALTELDDRVSTVCSVHEDEASAREFLLKR